MSDKEERVFVLKLGGENCEMDGYCVPFNCAFRLDLPAPTCGNCNQGMTRAEAVERMAGEMFRVATAICGDTKKNWRDVDLLPSTVNFYVGMAEAALDALITTK